MTLSLFGQQFAIGFDNQLSRFAQILTRFIHGFSLRICASYLFNITEPPFANFFKNRFKLQFSLCFKL